jgi:hypothetical protein
MAVTPIDQRPDSGSWSHYSAYQQLKGGIQETHEVDAEVLDFGRPAVKAEHFVGEVDDAPALDVGELATACACPAGEVLGSQLERDCRGGPSISIQNKRKRAHAAIAFAPSSRLETLLGRDELAERRQRRAVTLIAVS